MDTLWEVLLLLGVGFFTGFVNTIAGGGSLITLPLLIFLGLPPNVANGTNRIPILIQSLASLAGFKSKGLHIKPFAWYVSIVALIGALIGAQIAIDIKGTTFNRILAVLMVLMVLFMVFQPRKKGHEIVERSTGKYFWLSMVLFFFIGVYAGFIQAGTGIFTLLVLSAVNRISLIEGNVVKAVIILVLTIGALTLFIIQVPIHWEYGLYMAAGNAIGAWWSSRWSVKKGDKVVKIILLIMVIGMAVKLWFF
ncbi:sulfite exporter TauE/SafE family protein [Leptobacterium sp. I13]|uniref:sulfite exporter TauE/SafE family protein n=1 Tax=Leptobacterium meishanense TaxID=3128904 RepID=UPI0030EC5285